MGEHSPVVAGEQVTVRDEPSPFRHRNPYAAPSDGDSRWGSEKCLKRRPLNAYVTRRGLRITKRAGEVKRKIQYRG